MAKKKTAQDEVESFAKKNPTLFIILVVLVVVIVGCFALHGYGVVNIPFLNGILEYNALNTENSAGTGGGENKEPVASQGGAFTSEDITVISNSGLSVHFLELGNAYTGDCTLIKVGDTEVLIDAGSRKGSAETIVDYVNDFCTDGVLEFVIATHAHQDHIAGFVGTTKVPGVFESFECEVIIDYPLSNSTAKIRTEYETERDAEVALGATHYTALECYNEENGAQRVYQLGNDVKMEILYQRFYEESTGDENDYSVCMLLSQGENHYLFTGDLEKEGEESLVETYDLPKCVLFKGGHHGSPTSNTPALFAEIDPDIVCVCCCCGSDEYTDNIANMFPSQAFVNNVAPYTAQVYVTTIISSNQQGFESMNGNIVVVSNDGEISVRCSNNTTLFKDTEWFKENRETPSAWQ